LLADVSFLQEYMVMQDNRQNAMAIRRIRFAFIMTIFFPET
jgi:flagellar biosynthesis regulator FlbT